MRKSPDEANGSDISSSPGRVALLGDVAGRAEARAGAERPRVEEAAACAAGMLAALGLSLDDEHRRGTPERLARALAEMLTPPAFDPTTFDNAGGYDELVVVEAIPFHSLCEHHVLPFVGTATIAYLPDQRIAGLSKLAWVVQLFARRLQVQERMTAQIADWLVENLRPQGAAVRLRAEHLCMSLRGARALGSVTTTSACRGALADGQPRRREWLEQLAALPR